MNCHCELAVCVWIKPERETADGQMHHAAFAEFDLERAAFGNAPPLTIFFVRHLHLSLLQGPSSHIPVNEIDSQYR
jgi:hypothetical protein